jgi:hypothetical protein
MGRAKCPEREELNSAGGQAPVAAPPGWEGTAIPSSDPAILPSARCNPAVSERDQMGIVADKPCESLRHSIQIVEMALRRLSAT